MMNEKLLIRLVKAHEQVEAFVSHANDYVHFENIDEANEFEENMIALAAHMNDIYLIALEAVIKSDRRDELWLDPPSI